MEKASPTSQQIADSPMELEHAIGVSGKIVRAVYLHPNTKEFVYISGCSIVTCDLMDPHKQCFLRGHDDQITCLTISNDGKLIASGQRGDNSDVIVWDYEYKKAKFKLSEHDYEIVCVEFSHDDRLLFSCGNSMDKKIFIWDTSNGYIVGSVPMLPESINSMKWGGFVKDIKGRDTTKYQFATSGQKMIYLWKLDAKSGTFEQEFINTGSTIRQYLCLSFSKNREDYLFAGTSSGDFCAFQIKNKLLSSITNVCALGITSILSVTPELLVVGGGDGTVAAFHVEGHIITPLAKVSLPGTVNAISCSPDGVQLLTATDRGFVHRLKSADLTTVLQCENHTDSVVFIAYPDGVSDKFASCSEDGTIRRWDVNDYIVEGRCIGNSAGSPLCLVYADEVMLSGWEDGKIRMFRNDKNTQVWQIDNAHKGGVPTIALASNMKFLCSGGAEGGVRVWEMRSREMVSHLKEHTNRVTKVKLFDDDMHLLSSSRDKALLCWDLRAEKRISAHIQRMGGINCFDIVPGKNIVLTTGQDRKITYWDLREANPAKSYDTNSNPKKGDECMGLAISHDGRYFATGGSEQIVRLWDLAAGKVLAEGTGHSGCINTVAFSADDKQIVSGGRDGSILVWNLYL